MTLIVAAKHVGVPFLLSDSLVTGGVQDLTTQKIHRIRPDFVVGFTGHLAAAEAMLLHLREFFGSQPVTFTALRDVLAAFPEETIRGSAVELLGWFCDPEPVSFLWRSEAPSSLRIADQFARGSGAASYLKAITGGRLGSRNVPASEIHFETAILRELALLIEDEIGLHANRAARFGHSYEALVWTGKSSFEFLADSSIAFLAAVFDEAGRLVLQELVPILFVLRHIDGISVSERLTVSKEGSIHEAVNFTRFPTFISDAHVQDVMNRVLNWTVKERLTVQHSCLTIALIEKNVHETRLISKVPAISLDFDPQNQNQWGVWAEITGTSHSELTLAYRGPSASRLEYVYRQIRKDIARTSGPVRT
jgi:hypothetical protein